LAIFAIGDVQGCYRSLRRLVDLIGFSPASDRLWFVGDVVNRGPESLQVLRYIKNLGPAAQMVLGNHDLFLLAAAEGIVALRPQDTLHDVLAAEDRAELLGWLQQQPLHHLEGAYLMVHAGLLPQWTVSEADRLAKDVAVTLAGPHSRTFLQTLFHDAPAQWSSTLLGFQRIAAIARVLTRIRVCTPSGEMAGGFSGPPDKAPAGYVPWFEIPARQSADATIVIGHWAALGLHLTHNILALDSGCVWGRSLTAVRLEDRHIIQVPCHDLT
jgi:bis(5'-nucleosyl)-tetraphosphatase (symmetrical)